jgi:hypothetical protein
MLLLLFIVFLSSIATILFRPIIILISTSILRGCKWR